MALDLWPPSSSKPLILKPSNWSPFLPHTLRTMTEKQSAAVNLAHVPTRPFLRCCWHSHSLAVSPSVGMKFSRLRFRRRDNAARSLSCRACRSGRIRPACQQVRRLRGPPCMTSALKREVKGGVNKYPKIENKLMTGIVTAEITPR